MAADGQQYRAEMEAPRGLMNNGTPSSHSVKTAHRPRNRGNSNVARSAARSAGVATAA
jgi:hypothetical protein